MFESGGRLHRYTALVMLFLLLYAIYDLLLMPALDARKDAARRFDQAGLQFRKFQQLAASLPRARARAEALKNSRIDDSDLLSGNSPALAAAALQQLLRKVVKQADARLISIQTIDLPAEEGFRPVRLRLILKLTNEALIQLLYHLESMKPRGLVNRLEIRQPVRPVRRSVPAFPGRLSVRLEFTAFMVAG